MDRSDWHPLREESGIPIKGPEEKKPLPETWYAQHGEDRKLCELLGGTKNGLQEYEHSDGSRIETPGFYIDVGSWHPSIDSVTKYFYDRGWNGINIEPVVEYNERVKEERPRDINLPIAVSDHMGVFPFSFIPETGLSTFHEENAKNGENMTGRQIETRNVITWTLGRVCEVYVPRGKKIEFLKIDVEGYEEQVLVGANFHSYRPKIVVVEATVPGTQDATAVPAWENWEHILLSQDYEFLEFDGLNRWYRDNA